MEENNNKQNSYKMVNYFKKEKKGSFGKSVVVPFISGILGASLVMGVCFGVPSVNEKLFAGNGEVSIPTVSNPSTNTTIKLSEDTTVGTYAAQKILPSIVSIKVTYSVSSMFGSQQGTASSTGSGIILTEDGHILTNSHVVNSSSSSSNNASMFYQISEATKVTVKLYKDDTEYEAKIIGADSVADLAVIKIEKTGLTPAEIGNSDELQVGEFAMVAGNPVGLDFSTTQGSISALNREITDDEGNEHVLIQTDAAINSGNSGGALVNSKGQVVGVNFMKIASTSVEGICFAIPVTPNMEIIQQLMQDGKVKRPYIGIGGTDVDKETARRYSLVEGVYINSIDELSNAFQSGLKVGDVITELDGTKVTKMKEIDNIKYKKNIGDKITIKVNRSGEELTFEVTLTEMPAE